jgi:hypothetical protein
VADLEVVIVLVTQALIVIINRSVAPAVVGDKEIA